MPLILASVPVQATKPAFDKILTHPQILGEVSEINYFKILHLFVVSLTESANNLRSQTIRNIEVGRNVVSYFDKYVHDNGGKLLTLITVLSQFISYQFSYLDRYCFNVSEPLAYQTTLVRLA